MMFEDYATAIPSIWSSMNTLLSPVVLFVFLNVMIGIIAFTSKLANQTTHSINQQEHSQNHPNFSHNHHHQQQQLQQNKKWLARSNSIVEHVRSINLYSYRSQEPNLVTSPTNHNLEHTQKHESLSQYIFEQPHQENEHVASNAPSNNSHQNHQESTQQPQVQVQHTFEHTQEKETQKINASSPNTNEFVLNHDNADHLEQEQEQQEEAVSEEGDDELQSLDELLSNSTVRNITRTKSDTEPFSGEAPSKLPRKMRKSASMQSSFMHFEAEDITTVETRRPETAREIEHGVDAKADDFINMFRNQLKLQRMDSIIRYKEMITRGSEK